MARNPLERTVLISARACVVRRPARETSRGFTLVEVIVALAIVAMSLAAIGNLTSATFHSAAQIERRVALASATRAILAQLPGDADMPAGPSSGAAGAHRWRLDAAPVPTVRAAGAWVPEKFSLVVWGPTGIRESLEMIRLVRPRAP